MSRMEKAYLDPALAFGAPDDEAAVAAVIQAETQAFVDDDLEAWGQCWVHAERAKMVAITSTTGLDVKNGWDEISAEMEHVMHNNLGCDMVRFRNANLQIQIEGSIAWVVYDQWAESRRGATWETFETRILERTDTGWKIVYCSFVDQGRDTNGEGAISVDKSGQLIWANPETLEQLKHHPVLTVSAGRVRARRQDWDRVLQRAITQAGRYHGFMNFDGLKMKPAERFITQRFWVKPMMAGSQSCMSRCGTVPPTCNSMVPGQSIAALLSPRRCLGFPMGSDASLGTLPTAWVPRVRPKHWGSASTRLGRI